MRKIYCGGTFPFDYLDNNYKEMAKKDYRTAILGDVDLLLNNHEFLKINDEVEYIGPFYFESDTMIDKDIVNKEYKMINEATDTIFLLDDGLCPGTISELTLASTLNKNVYIYYVKKSELEETESSLHSPCWFPITLSTIINQNTKIVECKNYNDAKNKIVQLIENNLNY